MVTRNLSQSDPLAEPALSGRPMDKSLRGFSRRMTSRVGRPSGRRFGGRSARAD
jgi:hypothetical protein